MGYPKENRARVIGNEEEAILSRPWSIHAGVGIDRYSFVWVMGGENYDYNNMSTISPGDI